MRISILVLFLWVIPVYAQPHRHLDQNHELTTFQTLEEWLGHAETLRRHIRVSTGLLPMPVKSDLKPLLGPLQEYDSYAVQGIRLETLPGFYLTGTLYKPIGDGPFPAILTPHGHWSAGRFEHTDLASIPGRSIQFARMGYVAFAYSMIGYNETEAAFPHKFDDPSYQLWGFSAMGLQLWNSLRALDFIEELPDVDANRIGMTGASGGGTQTFMLTAIDERIKVSAPVNMISAHFQGGCICENAPLLRLATNNVEIGALAAPRPMMMISTSGDWSHNTPDVEFPAIRRIYDLFDAGDHLANTHLDYPHNYNQESREAVYAWFNAVLKDDPSTIIEDAITIPEIERLEAPTAQEPASLDEVFAEFRAQSEHQFVQRTPSSWPALNMFNETYGPVLDHSLATGTTDIHVSIELLNPPASSAKDAVIIVHDQAARTKRKAEALAKEAASKGSAVVLFNPFDGDDTTPPDSIAYWTTYNPTAASHRVAKIQAVTKQLNDRQDVTAIRLVGLGQAGVSTLLARTQLPFVDDIHIDFNNVAYEKDSDFIEYANIPLIRRAGDFKTAIARTLTIPSYAREPARWLTKNLDLTTVRQPRSNRPGHHNQ